MSEGNSYGVPMGTHQMPEKNVSIGIDKLEVPTDPKIAVFHVEINNGKSVWLETLSSEEALRNFLRGVSAGAAMFGDTYVTLCNAIPLDSKPLPR